MGEQKKTGDLYHQICFKIIGNENGSIEAQETWEIKSNNTLINKGDSLAKTQLTAEEVNLLIEQVVEVSNSLANLGNFLNSSNYKTGKFIISYQIRSLTKPYLAEMWCDKAETMIRFGPLDIDLKVYSKIKFST